MSEDNVLNLKMNPPRPKTIKKVLGLLRRLHKHLKTPTYFPFGDTLRANHLPKDYGKIIIDTGIVSKIGDGTRGATTYVWNKEIIPDESLAATVITSYTRLRKTQDKRRLNGGVKPTNEKHLLEIKQMLHEILSILNPTNL